LWLRWTDLPTDTFRAGRSELAGVAVLGAAVVLSEHEHTDVEIYTPMAPASHFAMPALTTSTAPMVASYDGANDVAIRNHYYARRVAFAAVVGWTSTSSAAVLTSTSDSMTWLPSYPAIIFGGSNR
jgi:hypothetical protein